MAGDDAESVVDNAVAAGPIQRPDTQPDPAAKVDSLGRSMANKRGRKPGVSYLPGATPAAKTKVTPMDAQLSDENVGKAIAGIFALASLPLGSHWKLFAPEQKELGECFGPFARMVGPEAFGQWLTGLTIMPVAINIVAPRLAIQRMIYKKDIPIEAARPTLLMIKAGMEAEKVIDIERQVTDSKDYLKATVAAGAEAAAQARIQEIKANNAAAEAPPVAKP